MSWLLDDFILLPRRLRKMERTIVHFSKVALECAEVVHELREDLEHLNTRVAEFDVGQILHDE